MQLAVLGHYIIDESREVLIFNDIIEAFYDLIAALVGRA